MNTEASGYLASECQARHPALIQRRACCEDFVVITWAVSGRGSLGASRMRTAFRLDPPEGGQRIRGLYPLPRGEWTHLRDRRLNPGFKRRQAQAALNQRIDHGGIVPCGTQRRTTSPPEDRRSNHPSTSPG